MSIAPDHTARRQAAFCPSDRRILLPSFAHRHNLPMLQTWLWLYQIARRRAVFCLFDTRIPSPFSLRRRNLSTLQTLILRYHTLPRPEASSPPHIRFQTVPLYPHNPCIRPNRYTRRRLSHTVHSLPPASPADNGIPELVLLPQDNSQVLSLHQAQRHIHPAPFDLQHRQKPYLLL